MSTPVRIQAPAPQCVAPYGWLLGKPFPTAADAVAFRDSSGGFWREHLFDPGAGGEVEILWVDYRNADPLVGRLEQHHVTEQAVVPLTGAIVQIVALSTADGAPDLATVRAFRLSPGVGLCMRPGVWHATRSKAAACLMLTRRSTTIDLVRHLKGGDPAADTALRDVPPIRLVQDRRRPRA